MTYFETVVNKIHENMLKDNMDGALVELSAAILASQIDTNISDQAFEIMSNEMVQ